MHLDADTSRASEGLLKLTPHGSIDAQTSADFDEKARAALGAAKVLVLDMGHVEYVSSAGLQVLFGLKRDLAAQGGDLLFAHLRPQIAKLFQVVNALPKESIFATLEEADRYFYAIMNKEIRKQKTDG
jgi:anti-sigma B factor antagonist